MPRLHSRLVLILFEPFGKHIVQPHHDIFEKATGLSVLRSAAPSFLTELESDAAGAMARQHDLLGIHVEFVRSAKPAGKGRFGNRRNRRGDKPIGRGHGIGQLNRHFDSTQQFAQPSAQSPVQQSRQQ